MLAELDVRAIPKPQRHALIHDRFAELAVGDAFVLVNDHDPRHLRDEFERELAGSFAWTYDLAGPQEWRVRIARVASTPLPRLIGDTAAVDTDTAGAVWKLEGRDRELDANLIHLPAGGGIDDHAGADIDVLWVVLSGSGTLRTEGDDVSLRTGSLVWLPPRSRRGVTAGPGGLGYLTVHRRRAALQIASVRPGTS